jgi:hypothetical protein
MKTFTDAAGRNWTIHLTLGAAMQVKDALGIDLLQPEQGDPPLLTRLGTDELLLGQVICELLAGQFEAHRVTEDDVRNSFDGASLLAAQTAFYEELVDFFRKRGRTDRAKAVETQATLIAKATAAIEARIDAFDLDQALDASIPGAKSGGSPAPSASIPDR